MPEKNYYLLLEVKSTATFDEIKKSYRILVKKYHPDKNTGNKAAEEYFKEIQEAYAVLSNTEKRKKYDLQFLYRTSYNQQRSYQGNAPFTGNAYQYAQQQAQAKPHANHKKQKAKKKDNSESMQIIVSIAIAIILVYFIISYSSQKNIPPTINVIKKTTEVKKTNEVLISNFESPYSNFFGPEIFDSRSKNNITIFNSEHSEAIVCLIEKNAPNRTIRNQYMNSGTIFKMNEIPDGTYFLKVYFGKNWNPEKTFLNLKVKGGFTNENIFFEMNTGKTALYMKHEKIGASDSYSSYEIKISPFETKNVEVISSEDFFRK